MNTQNTPIHVKLWHKEFWQMAVANWLLHMSVYILIPVLPLWMMQSEHFSVAETGLAMGVFGVGLYLLGAFCSYLVQHFRRNKVCMWAIFVQMLSVVLLYYIDNFQSGQVEFWMLMVQRTIHGAAFGLSQMVLASTLIIDTCESFQRTEANHSATWFSRFALSLGPLAGLIAMNYMEYKWIFALSACCSMLAVLLIKFVDFPFRAPADYVKLCSLDRFFLPHGFLLYLNLMLITMVIGLLMSLPFTYIYYGMLMAGFLLALLAGRFVFPDAELKSEVMSGLILMGAALLMLLTKTQVTVFYLSPLLIGMGIGIIGARFLLFFIKLSRHCQRGTSQSMYMLGWETGICIGLLVGYNVSAYSHEAVLYVAFGAVVVALLMYHGLTHQWFLAHKNR